MLFLLFNCVCTAAPVLKLTGENHEGTVSMQLVQVPGPLENEEENHATAFGYTNHINHFSVKQCDKCVHHVAGASSIISFFDIALTKSHIPDSGIFPVPGYYIFLFRYTLF